MVGSLPVEATCMRVRNFKNKDAISPSVQPAYSPEPKCSSRRKLACRDQNGKVEHILRWRRGQLIRLFRHRGQLQDNNIGRVRLLLELGLTGTEAQKVAPWMSLAHLSNLIGEVDRFPQFWTADKLGNRVELTFKEKVKLNIRNIDCFDKPKHEVDAFFRKRRRERDAERKSLKRKAAKRKIKAKVFARSTVVLEILSTNEWMSTGEIADRANGKPEFANLRWDAMRQAMGRAVRELVKAKLAEEQLERIYGKGVLGYMTRLVRKL
jgi:hypothetical protein